MLAMLPALFAATLFAAAALLFAVQPMAGKDLLPLAGGTPAVWTTCLLFFQGVLLLGYLYADRLTRLPVGRQAVIHLLVGGLGLAAAVWLRPDPAWIPDDQDDPTLGLVRYLVALVGVPFFAVSATAPLLQRWFAHTGHRSAGDPYFLYAASNAGSFVGLLAYPFAVEPWLPLGEQRVWWAAGFFGLVALVAVCGLLAFRRGDGETGRQGESEERPSSVSFSPRLPVSPSRFSRWVALAALPSSLLMSVTAHLTTDVAPVPLLWVVPLALYLVTFIVAFGYWPDRARILLGRAAPVLVVALAVALVTRANEPPALVAALHLAAFAAMALLCHGELAADRPDRDHLTRFYLAVSVGGVLGGLANAVVAPAVFRHVGPAEYPLGVVLFALVRPRLPGTSPGLRFNAADARWVVAFIALTVALNLLVPLAVPLPPDAGEADTFVPRIVRGGLMAGVPAAAAFALVWNPLRFAACLAVLFLVALLGPGGPGAALDTERNFFGTVRVTVSDDGRFTQLTHGTTLHGQQRRDAPPPAQPLMYYHRKGPVGHLFAKLPAERKKRVGVVGLGCGAMAAYAEPGQTWTFFEIDPAVVRIARDGRFFSFLAECQADECRVVTGDARRQLLREPDGSFDLIALDAFSSDAIPVHLLTREAFALYARKLAPGGVLAFHLSNRYLDLPPMVARVAAANDPSFGCRLNEDTPTDAERTDGKFPSIWMALARDPADLGGVAADIRWQKVTPAPGPTWRDDFSNLLAVWKRGGS
jgi:SAM-dependent methyltransferase